jgi:peroxiredoxin
LAIQETFKERATPVITEKLFEESKKADGYTTVIDLFEKLKDKKKLGKGYYVIGGNGFVIDERGNTKQIL